LYRKKVFDEENSVSSFFVDCATSEVLPLFDDDGILAQIRKLPPDDGRIPNAKQLLAVNACLTSRISTIQGSAGTGKTTALRLLARYIKDDRQDLRGNILFLAPTGKAVNRIKESLNDIELTASDNIMTIHRFAGLLRKHFNTPDPDTEPCVSSPVLIAIDESSMISLSTIAMFVNVVRMYPIIPHIVFMGDVFQLSPVGYGSPFMDLIESDIATNTTLDVVHRQGSGSALLTAVTDLRNAIQVSVSEPGLFEICLTKDVVKPLLRWIDLTKERSNESESSSVIIVPTRSLVGKLTPIVRDYINPAGPDVDLFLDDECQNLLEKYRKGDKIMQIKNNYGRSVFNGEMGVVVDLLKKPDEDVPYRLHVKFIGHEGDFYYSLSEAEDELTLAYVLNTHKAQGSEYDDVLIIMDQAIPNFIHRNHIYTAASRGKKSVKILITAREIMRLWKFTPMKPVTQMVQQIKDCIL
jgi:exodeoxyribonuclease V alpha subunit